jgi:hypothetical protein
MRTLFGTVRLASSRWRHSTRQPQQTLTVARWPRRCLNARLPSCYIRKQVRRSGLVLTECPAAGRDSAIRTAIACLSCSVTRASYRRASGGRARSRTDIFANGCQRDSDATP